MVNRRQLLQRLALAGAAGMVPLRPARAASASAADRKFLFIFNNGGWDQTRVFAPQFDSSAVSMENNAGTSTAGGISWVSHADRPSVDKFFQDNHSRTAILNGMLISSVSHFRCGLLALTGSASGTRSDWPAILGAAQASRYVLPQVVFGGLSFPGDLTGSVIRTGPSGQLSALLDGSILGAGDVGYDAPTAAAEAAADAYLQKKIAGRVAAATSPREAALATAWGDGLERAMLLKSSTQDVIFGTPDSLRTSITGAMSLLQSGLCRCVSIVHPNEYNSGNWDTHTDNDIDQSKLFEELFLELGTLGHLLDTTEGTAGGTLAEEVVVVVFSEMGRSPALNSVGGKDHWPWTSVMMMGPGIAGDQVIGGFDDNYSGQALDLESGEVSEAGHTVTGEHFGATVLALGDVDPEAELPGIDVVAGLLA